MKEFYQISEEKIFETKIKRSNFIAHLKYVETIREAKEYISQVSSKHKNADHNCWAFIVGKEGEIFHSSDAGEPSGTAGKPMLNTLMKYDLTNIVAVVTRYFGGVKLGVRGLIEAYSVSIENVIKQVELYPFVETELCKIETTYDFAEHLKYKLNSFSTKILNIDYKERVIIEVEIQKKEYEELEKMLLELENTGKIKYNH